MFRERFIVIFAALVVALVLPGSALAAGNGGNSSGNGTDQFGPIPMSTQDRGTCGNFWAQDTFTRYWSVHNNGDGTFLVMRQDKQGTFVTNAGESPNACLADSPHHGTTVTEGIAGTMQGYVTFDVVSAAYDPAACETADCSGTDAFLASVFPGYSTYCDTVCSWNFEYSSADQTLTYHHWQDKSSDDSSGEQFIGDIANE